MKSERLSYEHIQKKIIPALIRLREGLQKREEKAFCPLCIASPSCVTCPWVHITGGTCTDRRFPDPYHIDALVPPTISVISIRQNPKKFLDLAKERAEELSIWIDFYREELFRRERKIQPTLTAYQIKAFTKATRWTYRQKDQIQPLTVFIDPKTSHTFSGPWFYGRLGFHHPDNLRYRGNILADGVLLKKVLQCQNPS